MIVVLNFVLFRMMPGSPERILGRNPNVTPEMLAATRERWGLDKPLFPDQFVRLRRRRPSRAIFGFSFKSRGQTVVEVSSTHFWPTIILFGIGEVIAIVDRTGPRRLLGMETRRPGRLRRERPGAHPLLDAVFPPRHGPAVALRDRARLVPDVRDADGRRGVRHADRPVRRLPVAPGLPLTTVTLGLIGQYAILMRSSVIETLSRGLRHDGQGEGADGHAGPARPRAARTRCSRR